MKPFKAGTGGLGLAEVEKAPDTTQALRQNIERGIVLHQMTQTAGWKEFEKLLSARFIGIQKQLEETTDLRQIPRIQEQLKELRFVLGWVYSEINAAEAAKQTLQEQAEQEQANTGDE